MVGFSDFFQSIKRLWGLSSSRGERQSLISAADSADRHVNTADYGALVTVSDLEVQPETIRTPLSKREQAKDVAVVGTFRTIKVICSLSAIQSATTFLAANQPVYLASIDYINYSALGVCVAQLAIDIAEARKGKSTHAQRLALVNRGMEAISLGGDSSYFILPIVNSLYSLGYAIAHDDAYGRIGVSWADYAGIISPCIALGLAHAGLKFTKPSWDPETLPVESIHKTRLRGIANGLWHTLNTCANAGTLYFIVSTGLSFTCLPDFDINTNETGIVNHYDVAALYGACTMAAIILGLLNSQFKSKVKWLEGLIDVVLGSISCFAYVDGYFGTKMGKVCPLTESPAMNTSSYSNVTTRNDQSGNVDKRVISDLEVALINTFFISIMLASFISAFAMRKRYVEVPKEVSSASASVSFIEEDLDSVAHHPDSHMLEQRSSTSVPASAVTTEAEAPPSPVLKTYFPRTSSGSTLFASTRELPKPMNSAVNESSLRRASSAPSLLSKAI